MTGSGDSGRSSARPGQARPARVVGAGRGAHGAREIGLGQREVVDAAPLGREERVVRGVGARVEIRELLLVVEAGDDGRRRAVDLLERAVGAAHLLVAHARLGLEDLVVGLILLEAERPDVGGRPIALAALREQAARDALDVLRDLGLGVLGHERAAPARREPHRLVGLDVAEVLERVPEPPPRRRLHPAAELEVGQRARLVDDEARPVAADLLLEALGGAAALARDAEEIERRARRALRVRHELVEAARRAQAPHEAALDEAVGRLDRRRVGQRHENGHVGREPEIEPERRVGRPEVG